MDYRHFRNIIFDLGGVLVRLDFEAARKAFARLGMGNALATDMPEDIAQLFERLGRGLCSTHDFCEQLRNFTGSSATDADIEAAADTMLRELPDRKKARLLALKAQGHHLFLLSNTFDMHWDYCVKHLFNYQGYSVDDYFDQVFLSQRMHLQKPDAEIFRQALAQAGLQAADTLFIDDLESNCQAAERLGITTFRNKDFDDWLALDL